LVHRTHYLDGDRDLALTGSPVPVYTSRMRISLAIPPGDFGFGLPGNLTASAGSFSVSAPTTYSSWIRGIQLLL
jgi:hypothetical protein